MDVVVREDNIGNVLAELEGAYFDIPFENSNYQNRVFVMAAQQTPARAYRAIGLRMFAKIRAVKEYLIQRERNQIDIEEKQEKIAASGTSEFDRRRLRLDILQLEQAEGFQQKLLNDALQELNCLYAEFKKLPRFTRDEFEDEERRHFEAKLTRALKQTGAAESLLNMSVDAPKLLGG